MDGIKVGKIRKVRVKNSKKNTFQDSEEN